MGGNWFDKILTNIKGLVGETAFNIFLWSIGTSEEEYIENIYLQEKEIRGQ